MTGGGASHVLVVAATDSSGGAGLARDLETLGALGVRGAVAVTAVTVQTDDAVESVSPVPPDLIERQMRAALASNRVAAIKIGMLGSNEAIGPVAGVIGDYSAIPVVLDPVIGATSGAAFLDSEAIRYMTQDLLPLCTLVTPNLPELGVLGGDATASSPDEAISQAWALQAKGACAVLVKGGHGQGDRSVDILVRAQGDPLFIDSVRLTASLRGTGCMLSSAIAAHLAMGAGVEEACRRAKEFVWSRIAQSAGSKEPLPI